MNTLAGYSNTLPAPAYRLVLRSIPGGGHDPALPIAPVIPPPSRVVGTPRVTPAAVRPLPMAGPAAALSVPADVVYGIGRIDASGRVTDQAIACALGWQEGDRLTLTASPVIVTARRIRAAWSPSQPVLVSRFRPCCAAGPGSKAPVRLRGRPSLRRP